MDEKNIYFCFIDYTKAFDYMDHNKLWKILKKIGISDHLTCLQRNLYVGQEATVGTGHGTKDWFKIRKGVCQGCILSLWLFNYMWSTSCEMPGWMNSKLESRLLGEISTTSDADDTTLVAESKEELKSLLVKVEEENEISGLKLNTKN